MDRTPGTSDAHFLVNLLTRLKRALWPPRTNDARQLVVLADGLRTITPLMIAAFHENCEIHLVRSPEDAMAAVRSASSAALAYDWDSSEGDWQGLCRACVQRGFPFYLVASNPSDDLFLAVACTGGSGVLWKPLSAEQTIEAFDSTRSLTRTAPDDPYGMDRDIAERSAIRGELDR